MFLWQRCLETEGGCTVNVRKTEKKEIASRLPRHQKKDTFFISYLAYKKKKHEKTAESAEEGDGEIAGQSAKKWNCLVWEPAWRAGLKLEKFLKENSQPLKKKKEKLKKHKKRLNVQVGDEVYFVIRKRGVKFEIHAEIVFLRY